MVANMFGVEREMTSPNSQLVAAARATLRLLHSTYVTSIYVDLSPLISLLLTSV